MLTPEETDRDRGRVPALSEQASGLHRRDEDRAAAPRLGLRTRALHDIGELLGMSDDRPGWRRHVLQPDLPPAGGPPRDLSLRQRQLLDHGLRPAVRDHASERLGIRLGETTADDRFTLLPIVCLGACDHAPVMMIDDDLHLDLTPRKDRPDTGALQVMPMEKPLTGNMRADGAAAGPRCVRARRRLSGAAQGVAWHDAGSSHRGSEGLEPARPRRRGLPHRAEVELRSDGTDAPHPRYLVANADEMEPGTFKDRLLMEGDPHQLIEGMILAGYAIEADVAYIFLRGEYKLAATSD